MPGFAGGTTLITVQFIGRPVIAANGATKVGKAGQAAGLRGVNEDVAIDRFFYILPDYVARALLALDLLQVYGKNTGRAGPVNLGDIITVVDLDLPLVLGLGQVALQESSHIIYTIELIISIV